MLRKVSRIPSKMRRLIAVGMLKHRYRDEDPGLPPSSLEVAILIPVVGKDLPTLRLAVASVRRFIQHPVRQITLIAPDDPQIRAAADEMAVSWLNELDALPETAAELTYRTSSGDRTGWIRQQIIKLAGDGWVSTSHFLVLDADTVFVRPVVFRRGQRDVLFCSDEYHDPYYDAYRRLTGVRQRHPLSFVSHHMLFSATLLRALRARIESHTNMSWVDAIHSNLRADVPSCFSEYEMYGNFCVAEHPDRVTTRYWYNHSLPSVAENLDELVDSYGARFNTVSMHSYAR